MALSQSNGIADLVHTPKRVVAVPGIYAIVFLLLAYSRSSAYKHIRDFLIVSSKKFLQTSVD